MHNLHKLEKFPQLTIATKGTIGAHQEYGYKIRFADGKFWYTERTYGDWITLQTDNFFARDRFIRNFKEEAIEIA